MITNNYNLPEAIVRAVSTDGYSSGGSDITVTQLISPPQMVAIKKQHIGEIHEDVSDRIWALFGTAMHHVLERSASEGDIVEQRVSTRINGWKVSGQFDLLTKEGTLIDYKSTSVWSIIDAVKNGKWDWEAQLNLLAYLCDCDIFKLQILAICRDWRNSEAMRNPDYPEKAVLIDIPLWTRAKQEEYLHERVDLHQQAQKGFIPPCTDEERWYAGEKWAVMKKGRKSAFRLLDSEGEAYDWCVANGHGDWGHEQTFIPKSGISVEHRPGTYNRCMNYCSVAEFCPQFNKDSGS